MLLLALVSKSVAEDVTFSKAKYSFSGGSIVASSISKPYEIDVDLSFADSKMSIRSKKAGKKVSGFSIEIPYSSIDSISVELSMRRPLEEAKGLTGPILNMAIKTTDHWLAVKYHEGASDQSGPLSAGVVVLRLDKSEYEGVIKTVEARAGKRVAILDGKAH